MTDLNAQKNGRHFNVHVPKIKGNLFHLLNLNVSGARKRVDIALFA